MFRFYFSGLGDRGQLRDLVDFLALQNLGYPNYDEWVQRTEVQLDSGYKRAVLAFCEGRLVGNLIYQPHKSLSGLLEIKNLRIADAFKKRDFGRFMLKQVEAENPEFIGAIGDIRPDREDIVEFMQSCGYIVAGKVDLYDGNKEVVVVKPFRDDLSVLLNRASPLLGRL